MLEAKGVMRALCCLDMCVIEGETLDLVEEFADMFAEKVYIFGGGIKFVHLLVSK